MFSDPAQSMSAWTAFGIFNAVSIRLTSKAIPMLKHLLSDRAFAILSISQLFSTAALFCQSDSFT